MNVGVGRATTTLASLVVVGAIAAGCSSSSSKSNKTTGPPSSSPSSQDTEATTTLAPTTTTSAVPEACSLITQDDANKAIGMTLQAAVPGGSGDQTDCTFTAPPTGPTGQVQLFSGPGAKTFLDTDQRIGHTFTAVPDIGDEATIEPGSIFFRVGTTWFGITIVTTSLSDQQVHDGLVALAKAAVAKVPS